MNRAEELLRDCARIWAPPPRQSLSEWAEEHFILSPEYSARTGEIRLYQFQREILDSFTDPYVREIVVMSATQMIKTLLQQIAIAYVIARDPGPILAAQPTETDAETFSKERLSPMIRDMECLRNRVAPERRTSKSNTTLHKVFPGGSLSLIGAQTAGNFARRSIRYFFADERDKWPRIVGKEGDGFALGVKRLATFRSLSKIVQTCSPTIQGNSQIAEAYEKSDQRKFVVPCPRCGHYQVLRWAQVKDPRFPGQQPAATAYLCEQEGCGALWSDVERWAACERGEFRGGRPFEGIAGFWISELYSPWKRLGDMVTDFLSKKDDPLQLQTFVNTSLAETWREPGEAPPDYEKLMARTIPREGEAGYRFGQVPPGVAFLTAGVDVQKRWIETYVWGWGPGRQRWLIDHARIEKDPFDRTAWDDLGELLDRTYRGMSGGDFPILRMAVDTGYAGNEVYAFARQRGAGRVLAVDGRAGGLSLVSAPSQVDVTVGGRRIKHGCKLWPVNVSAAKSELYGLLAKERPEVGQPFPPGWVHFPVDADEQFFLQLVSEEFRSEIKNGIRKFRWTGIENRRHEALDCANYARAAAFVIGMDRHEGDERWWRAFGTQPQRREERRSEPVPNNPREVRMPEALPDPSQRVEVNAGSDWIGDRGGDWF